MDTSPRPRHCPFCRSPDTEVFECDVGRWAVNCSSCMAIGPTAASVAEAVDRWDAALAAAAMRGADNA